MAANDSVLIYPASQAPNYKVGYKMALVYGTLCIPATYLFWWLHKRQSAQTPADSTSDSSSERDVDVEEKGVEASGDDAALRYDGEPIKRKMTADDAGVH